MLAVRRCHGIGHCLACNYAVLLQLPDEILVARSYRAPCHAEGSQKQAQLKNSQNKNLFSKRLELFLFEPGVKKILLKFCSVFSYFFFIR